MPNPSESAQMSSILPKGQLRKLGRFAEARLPAWLWFLFYRFWVQTLVSFSRATIMLALALLGMFSFQTLVQRVFDGQDVYTKLVTQGMGLAVLASMNLWVAEREGATMEMLLMRIPSPSRLIWLKLHVVLVWVFILSLPLVWGMGWFISIPPWQILVYLFFVITVALFAVLLTCVVSTFVRNSLASAIITLILLSMFTGISETMRLPLVDPNYHRLMIFPFNEDFIKQFAWPERLKILFVNRMLLFAASAALYAWLVRRLGQTEKWIG